MIVKLLGFLDLLAAAAVVFVQLGILGPHTLYFFCIYLAIKGVMFIKSPSSMLDIGSAIYILLMIFGLKFFFAYIVAIYLFQKAVFSFA
ncbi:hypothetical protein KY308_01825 [Candidatus Woesearchaeota archaeon]|nr:hypothetical protein [Candidatus Woesearchaeota archaeon]